MPGQWRAHVYWRGQGAALPTAWCPSLSETFGSLLNWLSGAAHNASIHLTEFGHLGQVVVIDPFSVLRLDFYCLLKRLDANEAPKYGWHLLGAILSLLAHSRGLLGHSLNL
jgi:hypothetical protein